MATPDHPRSGSKFRFFSRNSSQRRLRSRNETDCSETRSSTKYTAVVAIDFGTTYSGYAYAFTPADSLPKVQVMSHRLCSHRGDGKHGFQQPTVLLLTSEGQFHSFGYEAQQYYRDMDEYDAPNWMYFEKFKMELHSRKHLHEGMQLIAANGRSFPAVLVFAHSLNYFKHMCLQELGGQMLSNLVTASDIQWVITVPAIWRESAKQFMRRAAVEAGLIKVNDPHQLIIALEPEAASIYCQSLQLKDFESTNLTSSHLPACSAAPSLSLSSSSSGGYSTPDSLDRFTLPAGYKHQPKHAALLCKGVKYVVADCGGGTVDLTLHQMEEKGKLKELYKASGGAWGSIGVDYHFEMLLVSIFGQVFIERFIKFYPISWLELMSSFEVKKRYFDPSSQQCAINIMLPFSFMESFRQANRKTVEQTVMAFGNRAVQWSSQGNLRLLPEAMSDLFHPVIEKIIRHIHKLLSHPCAEGTQYIFLVGGFSESPVLQEAISNEFGNLFQVIIPQEVSLCTIKGAVMFGLDTTIVQTRHAALTYGVGCLHTFNSKAHPSHKKVIKDGKEWCTDVFDTFVSINQPISQEKKVTRYYYLANSKIKSTVITLFASEKEYNTFVTDAGVSKIADLKLELSAPHQGNTSRELKVTMDFSKTEVIMSAVDCATGQTATVQIDFLYKQ